VDVQIMRVSYSTMIIKGEHINERNDPSVGTASILSERGNHHIAAFTLDSSTLFFKHVRKYYVDDRTFNAS
jgi:hypothetical protein